MYSAIVSLYFPEVLWVSLFWIFVKQFIYLHFFRGNNATALSIWYHVSLTDPAAVVTGPNLCIWRSSYASLRRFALSRNVLQHWVCAEILGRTSGVVHKPEIIKAPDENLVDTGADRVLAQKYMGTEGVAQSGGLLLPRATGFCS